MEYGAPIRFKLCFPVTNFSLTLTVSKSYVKWETSCPPQKKIDVIDVKLLSLLIVKVKYNTSSNITLIGLASSQQNDVATKTNQLRHIVEFENAHALFVANRSTP